MQCWINLLSKAIKNKNHYLVVNVEITLNFISKLLIRLLPVRFLYVKLVIHWTTSNIMRQVKGDHCICIYTVNSNFENLFECTFHNLHIIIHYIVLRWLSNRSKHTIEMVFLILEYRRLTILLVSTITKDLYTANLCFSNENFNLLCFTILITYDIHGVLCRTKNSIKRCFILVDIITCIFHIK